MKNNKNVSSFNRNTTSTVTAIFLVCLSNAESHPVTELLNCWAQQERYWPEKTYSLQNSEIQVIENMGTDIELLCLKIAFKTLCVYNCEGNISCNEWHNF